VHIFEFLALSIFSITLNGAFLFFSDAASLHLMVAHYVERTYEHDLRPFYPL
jgi:hypothetical protein